MRERCVCAPLPTTLWVHVYSRAPSPQGSGAKKLIADISSRAFRPSFVVDSPGACCDQIQGLGFPKKIFFVMLVFGTQLLAGRENAPFPLVTMPKVSTIPTFAVEEDSPPKNPILERVEEQLGPIRKKERKRKRFPKVTLNKAERLRLEQKVCRETTAALSMALRNDVVGALKIVRPRGAGLACAKAIRLDAAFRIVSELRMRMMALATRQWKRFVGFSRRRDAEIRKIREKSVKLLSRAVYIAVSRRTLLRWQWSSKRLTEVKDFNERTIAAHEVQRVCRGWRFGRVPFAALKAARREEARRGAAVAIQAGARILFARRVFEKRRKEIVRRKAATTMQSVWRGVVGRRRASQQLLFAREIAAATVIQNTERRRRAHIAVGIIRMRRREEAAAKRLQTLLVRPALARSHVAVFRRRRRRRVAATMIQTLARGRFGKRRAKREALRRDRINAARERAALCIETSFFRVAIARRACRMVRETRRKEAAAIVLIQARCGRGPAARQFASLEARIAREAMIADAQSCVETFDTEALKFFYATKHERLDEPPKSGYSRRDGMLVLTTGAVVRDPHDVADESEQAERAARAAANQLLADLSEQVLPSLIKAQGLLSDGLHRRRQQGERNDNFDAFCEAISVVARDLAIEPTVPTDDDNAYGETGATTFTEFVDASEERVEACEEEDEGTPEETEPPVDTVEEEETKVDVGESLGKQNDGGVWYKYNDDAGYPYFYNATTGVSTYDWPSDYVDVVDGGVADPSPSLDGNEAWVQVQDENGTYYWYNEATEARSPSSMEVTEQQAAEETQQQPSSSEEEVEEAGVGEWTQHQDENGYWYYYNSYTGESQYAQY